MNLQSALAGAVLATGLATALPAWAQTEIQLWHAMSGALGERVAEQVAKFNASQTAYKVVPSFKGSYTENMTAAIAAFRAGQPPHIVQVFEVGTGTMMAAGPAVKQVAQLSAETGIAIEPSKYLAGVRGYYSSSAGQLISMPYNSSSPVMWVNLDAFEKAGLSTTELPTTWAQVRAAATKIKASNAAPCAVTTAWPTWVMLENMGAMHNVAFSTKANGFDGLDTELQLTQPLFVKQVSMLLDMAKEGTFKYGGRDGAGASLFISGECAIGFNSSAGRAQVERDAKFKWASVPLPYHDDVVQKPFNGVIGGASLWTLTSRTRTPDEYKGVASFFAFISQADQDAWWHQVTGYVPLTLAAYEKSKADGYYAKNPGADAAILQLSRAEPTPASMGFRLGGFVEIRNIIQEELEKALQGQQTAEQALQNANTRGNVVLRNFERANRS